MPKAKYVEVTASGYATDFHRVPLTEKSIILLIPKYLRKCQALIALAAETMKQKKTISKHRRSQ
jgi:hypothetical protein